MQRKRKRKMRQDAMFLGVCIAALVAIFVMGFSIVASKALAFERNPAAMVGVQPLVYHTMACDAPQEPIQEQVVLYDVPLEDSLQLHIARLCEEHHIDSEIVMGIIWHESRFQPEVMGDQGRSYGLMQVQKQFHLERMDRLGVDDLLDPYQNVTVGVDILAEMIDHYDGNLEMALVAYQNGYEGADFHFFSKGVYENSFSNSVFEKAGEYYACT